MGLSCRACIEDDECPSRVCSDGSCAAESGIVYAANDGSSNSDCSLAAPCTVSRAIQLAKAALPQPTVRILPGVYLSGLNFSGATTSPLTVVASGATFGDLTALNVTNGAQVVIRGAELVGSNQAVKCGQTTTTDSVLTVLDAKLVAGDKLATVVSGGRACRILVSNTTLTVNDGVAIGVADGGSFAGDRLLITGVRPSIGMLFSDVHLSLMNSVLEDPQFQFSTIDSSTTSHGYFASNTIVLRSQFNQIPCNGLDAELTVQFENNIIVGIGTQDNTVIAGNECDLNHNILHPQAGVVLSNLDVDPQFVDAGGNYRVLPTSPAVDAANADPLALNIHDFSGAVRPQGAGPDIGAFEQ